MSSNFETGLQFAKRSAARDGGRVDLVVTVEIKRYGALLAFRLIALQPYYANIYGILLRSSSRRPIMLADSAKVEPHVDSKDRQIIRELQKDGRLTNQDLAEKVNLSPSPCLRRLRKLEREGVIQGYTALVDQQAY